MLLQTVQKEDGVIWSYKFFKINRIDFSYYKMGLNVKIVGNVLMKAYFKKIEEHKEQKEFKLVCDKCSSQNLYEVIKFESINKTTKKNDN